MSLEFAAVLQNAIEMVLALAAAFQILDQDSSTPVPSCNGLFVEGFQPGFSSCPTGRGLGRCVVLLSGFAQPTLSVERTQERTIISLEKLDKGGERERGAKAGSHKDQ